MVKLNDRDIKTLFLDELLKSKGLLHPYEIADRLVKTNKKYKNMDINKLEAQLTVAQEYFFGKPDKSKRGIFGSCFYTWGTRYNWEDYLDILTDKEYEQMENAWQDYHKALPDKEYDDFLDMYVDLSWKMKGCSLELSICYVLDDKEELQKKCGG